MSAPSTESSTGQGAPAGADGAAQELFGNYQFEIYAQGLGGERAALPLTYEELRAGAEQALTPEAYGYVAGGAGEELTVRANREAFERVQIVPRMLRDVSARDLSSELLGTSLRAPLLLAPIGVQSIVHPEGELATARGAAATGIPFILSTASSNPIETVAEAAGGCPRWYQLYWPRSRELAASFLARAQASGYSAVVVTLDTWMLGWRPRDLGNAYLPFLKGEGVANYLSDPVFRSALAKSPEEDPGAAIGHWAYEFSNPSVTWADLEWLREQTELPIVLKGILHAEDAQLAVRCGVDGVIVSNHGGRQVDGAIGALDALSAVREAMGEERAVLFDSGVRTGADIVKAIALGADAVCLGRPYVWGLGLGGQQGVETVIRCLLAELDLTLALSGYTAPAQLDPQALRARG